ncbi:hypothetical protein ACFVWL_10395 [Microbacterium sp. NPDC058269]|uniref:hypothetical protein n=1 Tax=Microbacterium sp. NPDC058269 TaxID=3346414 RepID=UPI0036D90A12
MSAELLLLCILAGITLGAAAWVPLALILTRTPKAGPPIRVTLTADLHAYQEAMRKAAS